MSSLLTLAKDLEQKSKAQQQSTGEMLKAAFSEHEKSVRAELSESEKRISAAILDHDRTLSSAMRQRTKGMLRMVSQTWLTIVLVSTLLIASIAGILWWQGQQILDNYTTIREQKSTQAHAVREEQRRATLDLRRAETSLCESERGSGTIRRGFELDDTGGK
nr:MbeB family mobilization protein [Escherichia sp. E2748]